MKKVLGLILAFVGFSLLGSAQGRLEVHAGSSMPIGSFSGGNPTEILDGSGCAAVGFSGGVKYFSRIKDTKGLSLTFGLDILSNGINQDTKNYLEKDIKALANSYGIKTKVQHFGYINIPVLVGLNYKYPLEKNVELFADAGTGVNFMSISDMVLTVDYQGHSETAKMHISSQTKLALQVGAGILIHKRFSVGLHYNQLGSYTLSGKSTSSDNTLTTFDANKALTINVVSLAIGYRF